MIEVYWKNDKKTVIQLDYSNPIASWDEYQEAVDKSVALANSVTHSVFMIHNPNQTPMPAGNPIKQMRRAFATTPHNVEVVVMVITNKLAKRMVAAALYIFQYTEKYKAVSSIAEADAYLASLEAFS